MSTTLGGEVVGLDQSIAYAEHLAAQADESVAGALGLVTGGTT